MAFRIPRVLPALLCLIFVLVVKQVPAAESRQWTDQDGQTTRASFVRVSGDIVFLKRGSRIIQVRLNELSQADRDYIDSQKSGSDTRFWTINRRKLRGSFRSYKNGLAKLSIGARTRDYPLRVLSQEDQDYIRALLEKDGKLADLPASDPIKLSASRNRSSRGSVDAIEHQPRIWTNDKGKEVEATFVRIDGENAILQRGSGGKEIPFPLERLSQADRKHIQDIQTRPQVAVAVAAPKQPAIPPMPRPNRVASSPTAQRRDTSAYRGASRPPTTPTRPSYGPSVDPSAQSTRIQERMAEQHRRSQAALEAQSNALSSAPAGPSMRWEKYKSCSKCMKKISSDIGAGDSCPHCGAFFDYAVKDDGTREYASSARRRGRQAAQVVYSIGTLMIFIGGIIFVKRKIFG